MHDAPAVSVCIPTYNYARFLGQAIGSVLAQTFRDFELIVIDDASTDDTEDVVAGFDDPRLRFVRNERNLGLFANFNRCLELGRADLVKMLCADDWLHPRFLEDGLAIMLRHRDVGLLSCASYLVDEEGRLFGARTAPFGRRSVIPAVEALRAQADFLNLIDMPSNTIFRRAAALEAGGFDSRFAPAADMHLWGKLLCRHDLGWLSEPRCYLRHHRTKEHDYGADPSESNFTTWEDLARRPQTRVDAALLRRAIDAEAERSLLYVVGRSLEGSPAQARRIAAYTSRHVSWPRAIARFVWHLPELVRGELSRIYARRAGRMVVYEPRPRIGGPVPSSLPAPPAPARRSTVMNS